MTTIKETVNGYIEHGLAPIPVPYKSKSPTIKDWQNLKLSLDNFHQYFPSNQQLNVGILNGQPSNGLVDVDLDCEETIKLAPYFLPETLTFGRDSKPKSHWLYQIDGDLPKTSQYSVPKAGMLVELRSTGSQTVFPPSVHQSGEQIEFDGQNQILKITASNLQAKVGRLAAASLLLQHYPVQGTRQDFALALSGVLLKGGWIENDAIGFVKALAQCAGDDNSRVQAVESTARAIASNKPVTQIAKLVEVTGIDTSLASKLLIWLSIEASILKSTPVEVSDEPCPWPEIADRIPHGFKLTGDGVFKQSGNNWRKISDPIAVLAETKGDDGRNHGLKVAFRNYDGEQIRYIKRSRLYEANNGIIPDLADSGFFITTSSNSGFTDYLAAFKSPQRLACVDRLGWTKKGNFALMDSMLGRTGSEVCVYQPEVNSSTIKSIHESGTLAEWQEYVAEPLAGNPIPVFCIAWALAAPLLELVGLDSGGLHLYGGSSQGKTTTLQIATSAIGCSANPSEKPDLTAIRTWNATANGLEGICAAYNNLLLPLDEIGQCTARDFGAVVYAVLGGQGKAALKSDRSPKKLRSWSLHLLSTGEVSGQSKIEETREAKAGQLIRLLDIPIPEEGLFPNTGEMDETKLFVEKIKTACSQYYGTALPAFINALLTNTSTQEVLKQLVKQLMDSCSNPLLDDRILNETQGRVATRFALVQAAGELAIEFDILPFTKQELGNAVSFVLDLWIGENGSVSDADRVVLKIRNFITSNLERFCKISGVESLIPSRMVGYVKEYDIGKSSVFSGEYYLFTEDGFRDACKGFDTKTACRELFQRGLLNKDHDQFKTRHTVPTGMGKSATQKLYAVKASILEHEEEDAPKKVGNASNFAQSLPITTFPPPDFDFNAILSNSLDNPFDDTKSYGNLIL